MKNLQNTTTLLLILLTMLVPQHSQGQNVSNSLGLNVICIDPGHGGHDPGCVSRDGKSVKEKDIVLSIGLKLKKYLNEGYPKMKVVMTRDSDRFIELGERAAIANRNNAGLFISIHINAVDPKKNKSWSAVNGFSIHTLGQSRTGADLYSSNMELCKRENSVILLENDYDTKYQGFNPNDPESYIIFNLMQNSNLVQSLEFSEEVASCFSKGPVTKNRGISQDPFLVLWKTTMPAVLIECGFITGSADLAKIRTQAGQEDIAREIYKAIVSYKKKYDSSMDIKPTEPVPSPKEPGTVEQPVKTVEDAVSYGTQILASTKSMKDNDPFFKSYKALRIKSGNLYKYFVGVSNDLETAKKENSKISKTFPGSFLVKITSEKVERLR